MKRKLRDRDLTICIDRADQKRVYGLFKYLYTFSARIDFRYHNLTPVGVRL